MSTFGDGSNVPPTEDISNNLHTAFLALADGSAPSDVQKFAAQEVTRLRTELELSRNAHEEMRSYYATATETISRLETEKEERRGRSRSSSLHILQSRGPEHLQDKEAMELDTSWRSHRNIAIPKQRGRELLPNTKAMKTCARNLLQKLARLRVRLVKVAEVQQSKNLSHAKQYYQFRLVSTDNSEIKIFEENRKQLDLEIATCTLNMIAKDLDEQITSIKNQLEQVGPQLRTELTQTQEHALASPDLSNSEKDSLREQ